MGWSLTLLGLTILMCLLSLCDLGLGMLLVAEWLEVLDMPLQLSFLDGIVGAE
jgi:hypothetical protein